MKFPLADESCIAMSFLADHGNAAWRAGLTSTSDEENKRFEISCQTGLDELDISIAWSRLLTIRCSAEIEDNTTSKFVASI
jgi:hypothetical protein